MLMSNKVKHFGQSPYQGSIFKRVYVPGYVAFLTWLVCVRLLFPLPGYVFGEESADAWVDFILWCSTLIMVTLGLWSSYKLIKIRCPRYILIFAVAMLIYAFLRVVLDRFAYRELWDEFVAGNIGAVLLVVRQMTGVWGVIETLLFLFLIPLILISALAIFILMANKNK